MGNEPIRILQVIGIMNRGGAESMIMNLYRNIDRAKVQFDFVENSLEHAAYDDEILSLGGRIFRCPHFTGKNYFQYKKWWEKFFREHASEYHVIHGHIGSTASIYLGIAKKHGLFTIAHSHSSGTDHSIRSTLYALVSFRTRFIADYFFACSEVAGIDRFGKSTTQQNNYRVLCNAIDTPLFRYNAAIRKEMRHQLDIQNEFLVGHIGRFTIAKNHTFLLDIFKAIADAKSDIRFILVGDGAIRSEMEDKAEKLGIKDRIIFTGVRSDVNRLMQAIDVFVFPSLFEGLPVTLVEAQASGLPCVISDKVPQESILTKKLVTVKRLEDSPKEWAEHIISRLSEVRNDHSEEIKEKGYDVKQTAKWLEEFYLEKHATK